MGSLLVPLLLPIQLSPFAQAAPFSYFAPFQASWITCFPIWHHHLRQSHVPGLYCDRPSKLRSQPGIQACASLISARLGLRNPRDPALSKINNSEFRSSSAKLGLYLIVTHISQNDTKEVCIPLTYKVRIFECGFGLMKT